MEPGEIIALIAITLILGGALWYIIKSKKSGRKCIGCPGGCNCGAKENKNTHGCCGCSHCGEQGDIEAGEEIGETAPETELSEDLE